jgi:hypothetical protein
VNQSTVLPCVVLMSTTPHLPQTIVRDEPFLPCLGLPLLYELLEFFNYPAYSNDSCSHTNMRPMELFPAQLRRQMMSRKIPYQGLPSMPLLRPFRVSPTLLRRQQQLLPRLRQGEVSHICLHLSSHFDYRVKKRKKAEPIPRNAFPHVVEKVPTFDRLFLRSQLICFLTP